MFFKWNMEKICWPVQSNGEGQWRDLVTRNWKNPIPRWPMMAPIFWTRRWRTIWYGKGLNLQHWRSCTKDVSCKKIWKHRGNSQLNCLCITNWMRSVVFPMVCLFYGSCYKKRFKGDVLCVQTSLTQLSSCNISAGYFFFWSVSIQCTFLCYFHPQWVCLIQRAVFQIIFFGLMSGPD